MKLNVKKNKPMEDAADELAFLVNLGMIAFNEGFILGQQNPTQTLDMEKFKNNLTELVKEWIENEKTD